MKADTELGHQRPRLGKDVIKEKHESMVAALAGAAQRLAKIDLAAGVGCQILDEKRAPALDDSPLDLRIAPESFWFFAHILHRQHEALGEPSGKGNAGRFAAGDDIERLEADLGLDGCDGEIDQSAPEPRISDDLAHVGIDGARPSGRKNEGLGRVERDGLDFQKHARGLAGDALFFGLKIGLKIGHGGSERGLLRLPRLLPWGRQPRSAAGPSGRRKAVQNSSSGGPPICCSFDPAQPPGLAPLLGQA